MAKTLMTKQKAFSLTLSQVDKSQDIKQLLPVLDWILTCCAFVHICGMNKLSILALLVLLFTPSDNGALRRQKYMINVEIAVKEGFKLWEALKTSSQSSEMR